jgi:hypothetical protein
MPILNRPRAKMGTREDLRLRALWKTFRGIAITIPGIVITLPTIAIN